VVGAVTGVVTGVVTRPAPPVDWVKVDAVGGVEVAEEVEAAEAAVEAAVEPVASCSTVAKRDWISATREGPAWNEEMRDMIAVTPAGV
jgi:hypothetical protein